MYFLEYCIVSRGQPKLASYPAECAVICYLGHEIIIAVALKRPVFWDMALCNLIEIYRHFEGCAASVLRSNV
jgi:hypothetical protein